MFDDRHVVRPRTVNPDPPPTDDMLFGHALHWRIVAYSAQAQIIQTFKALLVQKRLRRPMGRDGQLRTLWSFARRLTVEFDTEV